MFSKEFRGYFFQALLFITTVITTTLAGAELMTGKFFFKMGDFFALSHTISWKEFCLGFSYSLPFLGILTAHEFGHYFTAKKYKINVTLPYYIPLWLGFLGTSFGTMGAVIRIKSRLRTTKEFFDVGIAGPLAGFLVAIAVLWYGFTHLPPIIHIPSDENLVLGDNLLFWFFKEFVASSPELVPDSQQIIHYPFLFAGYLSLLFTALNLLPIGQLDGGHILYGLIGGKKHAVVSRALFTGFVFYAGLGMVTPNKAELFGFEFTEMDIIWAILIEFALYYLIFAKMLQNNILKTILWSLSLVALQFTLTYIFPNLKGYQGWMLFAFVLGRFLGVYHPPVLYETPLSRGRILLGWITLVIFILCFTPKPLMVG